MKLCRCLLFLVLWVASPAHADELRPGYLELIQMDAVHWTMTLKAPIREGLAAHARPILPKDCSIGREEKSISAGSLILSAPVTCRQSLIGRRVGLSGIDASITDVLARVVPLGRPPQVSRLTAEAPGFTVQADAVRSAVALTYLMLGVEHIIGGFDHLLFVLSLVLLIRGGWAIAKTVTAFTIAHSITLVATSLDFITVPRKPVEICIALSILFLAVEIVKDDAGRPGLAKRLPWIVAFAFGLLHGFGFAAALAEIGLPHGEVPMALLTFNIGVELGQLMIVAAALTALFLLARLAPSRLNMVRRISTYAIGTTAAYWMIERSLA